MIDSTVHRELDSGIMLSSSIFSRSNSFRGMGTMVRVVILGKGIMPAAVVKVGDVLPPGGLILLDEGLTDLCVGLSGGTTLLVVATEVATEGEGDDGDCSGGSSDVPDAPVPADIGGSKGPGDKGSTC